MRRFLYALGLLCVFFSASGQGLQIGDRVPAVAGAVRFEDYKGKLLVLDFWATWCAPCRAMVPRMDSLRRVFGGKVVFLPVAYESERVVAPVVAAMHRSFRFDLPEVTGDKVLVKLFPHTTLPHYVWIMDGKVRAVTEYGEVTAAHIREMLGGGLALEEKKDKVIPYDNGRPLLIGGNGGEGGSLVYHSVLTGYVDGLPGGLNVSALDSVHGQRFTVRNVPFVWLCRLAYADSGRWFPNARVRIRSKDSLRLNNHSAGQAYHRWLADGNGWCYELQVPPRLSGRAGFRLVREDLGKLFPAYHVSLETVTTSSLVLVRLPGGPALGTSGGAYAVRVDPYSCHLRNASLRELIMRLERQYLQGSVLPIADGTGYTGRVDLDIEASLSDVPALNKALYPYGLAFVEKEYPAELLFINDRSLKP